MGQSDQSLRIGTTLATFTVSLVLAAGCVVSFTRTSYLECDVQVRDARTNRAVQGARVSVHWRGEVASATTDANGLCEISLTQVSEGLRPYAHGGFRTYPPYRVTVLKDGYAIRVQALGALKRDGNTFRYNSVIAIRPLPPMGTEEYAAEILRTLSEAEEFFIKHYQATTSEIGGAIYYWTRDVKGLFTHDSLIAIETAMADSTINNPTPRGEYLFQSIFKNENVLRFTQGWNGERRSDTKFAFCAFPADARTGLKTLIINETGTIYMKDTRGKPPAAFPKNPTNGGWTSLED